jgi:hypothetical protein
MAYFSFEYSFFANRKVLRLQQIIAWSLLAPPRGIDMNHDLGVPGKGSGYFQWH